MGGVAGSAGLYAYESKELQIANVVEWPGKANHRR
jgi:hypothetical protein